MLKSHEERPHQTATNNGGPAEANKPKITPNRTSGLKCSPAVPGSHVRQGNIGGLPNPQHQDPAGQVDLPGISKRRRIRHRACTQCASRKVACSAGRPCDRCIRHHIPHLCRDRLRKREVEHPAEALKTRKSSPIAVEVPKSSTSQLTSFAHGSFRSAVVGGGGFPSQRKNNLLIPRPPPSAAFLQSIPPSYNPTQCVGRSPIQSARYRGQSQSAEHFHPSNGQPAWIPGSMGSSVARQVRPMARSSDESTMEGFQTHPTPWRSAQSLSPVNHRAAVGPYASFRYCSPLGGGLAMDTTRRMSTSPATFPLFASPHVASYSVSDGAVSGSRVPQRAYGTAQPPATNETHWHGQYPRCFGDQADRIRLDGTNGPTSMQTSQDQPADNASTRAIASGGPHSPLNPRLLVSGASEGFEAQDGPLQRYKVASTDSTLYHDTAPEYSLPTAFENGWNFSEPENSKPKTRHHAHHESDFAGRDASLRTVKSEAMSNTSDLGRNSPPLDFLGAEPPELGAVTDQQPGSSPPHGPPISCGSPSAPARAVFSGPITASLFAADNQDISTPHQDACCLLNSPQRRAAAGSDDWAHGEDMSGVFDLLLDQAI